MERMANMIKEVLKEWNLDVCVKQIYRSAWNVNDEYVLKEYEDKNNLRRNIEMFKVLYEAGIPVPKVCPLANGMEFCEVEGKMYLLTTKLKGSNIVDIHQCDKAWFYNFGVILAKLHMAFKECEKILSVWNNSLLEEMEGWVSKNLDKFAPDYLPKDEIDKTIFELSLNYQDLPSQLIHRDVHLGNFLFEDRKFSGYIDFDLSQSNIRIFDLCYFLLGILTAEDNNRLEIEDWYMIVNKVVEGYGSLMPLKKIEKQSIVCVMKSIELLFTAYFLGAGNETSAKKAADLFLLVCRNEEKILEILP